MASSRFSPEPPDRSNSGGLGAGNAKIVVADGAEAGEQLEPSDYLALIGEAERISKEYHGRTVEKPLNRSYRAWQNLHASDSKYLGPAWRGRSRVFVPKTRTAVRKNLATAAASLFSTEDVVNISAQFEDDPQQRATAAVIKADLDYRLTRSSAVSGIPWYLIAMGGCLDGQLTGVTISKQYWEYVEVPTGKFETREEPVLDEETGLPMLDETGFPVLAEVKVPITRVVRDRPMIDLIPIENVGVDPAAPWYSPVQLGRWFYARYPMGLSDARALIASNGKSGNPHAWLDVTDDVLLRGKSEDERASSRRVREGGGDRFDEAKSHGELDIVWLQENFLRINGKDWHFWSVGRHALISEVREVHEVYPEFGGERPYVMGVAQLDTHRVFPQSPVETWQPLQLEINDIANLRLDTLKRSIAPLTVVKRGKNVDLAAVQRRGQPDAIVMVDNPAEDVVFTPTPGPSGASYTETSVNNAMFDELSGTFSTSSVQSSRQLNETVGGMRLMSGAANAVSEFDLRMWIETWVEPVLRHLVHLVRYYESDERILAIAGQNARVWTRFEYMPNIEDFEQTEVSLRVNAGIGALDPMQKLQKLRMAMEMLAPLMPEAQKQGFNLDMEALIEEVMGGAGFRDGMRFFKQGEPAEPQPDPELMRAMEELKLERDRLAQSMQELIATLQSEDERNRRDNATKIQIETMRVKKDLAKMALGAEERRRELTHQRSAAIEDRDHTTRVKQEESAAQRRSRMFELLAGRQQRAV